MEKKWQGKIYRRNTVIGIVELPFSANPEQHCLNVRSEEIEQNMHHITGSGRLSFCILRPNASMVRGVRLPKHEDRRKKR